MVPTLAIDWVVLTMGDRGEALDRAVESLQGSTSSGEVVVIENSDVDLGSSVNAAARSIWAGSNRGVPGGRDFGAHNTDAPLIGFLDDDAELRADDCGRIAAVFADREDVGAVALRLVDEVGETARRHVPRRGGDDPDVAGDVALFLGGACVIRRTAYEQVGGYFRDLHYGHEEVELCWRLVDAGWTIAYLPEVEVFHPRTDIARHTSGWRLTGRNRVWIARRTLPLPIAAVHVMVWLALGLVRAPAGCRGAYLRGWTSGWRGSIDRRPIRWSTVWRLARLGRPPLF